MENKIPKNSDRLENLKNIGIKQLQRKNNKASASGLPVGVT
jgi:hypothetical protein